MAHGTDQINELITSTLHAYEKSGIVQDTIFAGDPLLSVLESNGKKQVKGGTDIVVNLRYGKNGNVGSYAGLDTMAVGEIDTIAHAKFGWKQYSGAFLMPNSEMLINGGSREQIVDLWKEKVETTILSLKDNMIADLYGDGTGNSGKDLLGLAAVLSPTGILGGIDRSLAPWWIAKNNSYTVENPTLARIQSKIRQIRGPQGRPDKQGKVDMLLCNGAMYDYIVSLVDAKSSQTTLSGPVAKLGFDAIRIAGAELTWSELVPAGELWYLSTDYFGLRVLPGRDFAFTDPIDTTVNSVDATAAYCKWMGNLTVSNCRYLGRDYGYVIP